LSHVDNNAVACCVLFASAFIGTLSLLKKNFRQALTVPVCLFTAAAACLLFLNFNLQKQAVQNLTGDALTVEAVVAEAPYIKSDNGRHYCVLELCSVDGKDASGRLRLSFSPKSDGIDENDLETGNSISFTGKVYIPGEGEKSISRYFTGENILLGAYGAENFRATESVRKSIDYYFQRLRDFVSDKLRYGFGNEIAGLLIGMLTGDKSSLDPELYEAFRMTGSAHLLAVSGLHLSLWVFALGSLIPEKRKNARLRTALLMSAVIFIMLLAGMSESVKRAGFMSLVFLSGKLLRQDCDSLNSLGFAVTVMLLCNPSCILSLSMQLSFLSTLGILTLGKCYLKRSAEIFGGKSINTPLKKLIRYTADMFFLSISVLVFTFPVLLISFGGFSAVSAWVNILISPIASPLLILAGLCVLLSDLTFAFYPIAITVKFLADYVISVTNFFSEFENAYIVAESDNTPQFLAAAVLVAIITVVFLCKPFKDRTTFSVISIILVAVVILSTKLLSGSEIKIHLADYGDTFAVAVQKDKSAVLLCDTDEYEKGLFISELGEKGINAFCELVDGDRLILKSLRDGKYITDESTLSFFDGFLLNPATGKRIFQIGGKYIHIFYGEALHYDDCCDIIIKITKNDIVLRIGGSDFSLKKEKSLILTVKKNNKMILRGEDPWLNLMKSS